MTAEGKHRRVALSAAALVLLAFVGCSRGPNELGAPATFKLSSPAIGAGVLGRPYTCSGPGISPELRWGTAPVGTRSLALVVTDLDSRFGYDFVHWVLYDIPPSDRSLPAGFASQHAPAGIERGLNDRGDDGYVLPCPPGSASHRYAFVLYALDKVITTPGMTKAALLAAARGHVLAKGRLIGRAQR